MSRNESQTRQDIINHQLAKAGWGRNNCHLIEEYFLRVSESEEEYVHRGFADYALLGMDRKPIAIVEAKRTCRDTLAGKRQAADYADEIKKQFGLDPFIFLTNGQEIYFWDRERYPPRKIAGFSTRDDLERLLHQRRYAQPLNLVAINSDIAGRDYQNDVNRRAKMTHFRG